jgi:glycosyltransferase involved in cell wall biosynthesis
MLSKLIIDLTTFADMITLLLAFFVLILSFSDTNVNRFKDVSGSLQKSLGNQDALPTVVAPPAETQLVAGPTKDTAPLPEQLARDLGTLQKSLSMDLVGKKVQLRTENGKLVLQLPARGSGIMPQEMIDLYRSADVFVLPSKGEAWGLPIIEAAATGLPIISTMYSGHKEFLQSIESSVLSVDHTLGPINCAEFKYFYPTEDGNYGNWAMPKPESIAAAMHRVYQNLNNFKVQARDNAEIIRQQYSWQRCVDRVLKTLQTRGLLK